MDHVVVAELGLELEGDASVEGRWLDRVVGLDDARVDVAMVADAGRRTAGLS